MAYCWREAGWGINSYTAPEIADVIKPRGGQDDAIRGSMSAEDGGGGAGRNPRGFAHAVGGRSNILAFEGPAAFDRRSAYKVTGGG